MAITPQAGYQVDPANANGVVPVAQPAAQTPTTPAPQIQTPALPTANPNAAMQVPGATPTTTIPAATPTPATPTTATQPAAVLPASGSVVDLLNQAGQDSSFAARQQLAQKYGIQGYTGTAAQNQDLSKKYLEAFNANKGTAAPQTGAQASSALDSYFQQNSSQPQTDPQANFIDQYFAMNPVVKSLYDTINQTLSSIGTQQTFTQQYQDLVKQQGIPALQTDLMNINNVMDGTEDDIRDEITKAGGFATESQVQALTGARNKTLLKQANVLSNQLQAKEDYVNQIMQFSQADRNEVDKQLDQKLNLTTQLANMQDKITSATKDNYDNIIQTQGYGGLYTALQAHPQQLSQVETLLGLGQGGLKQLAGYTKPLTQQEQLQNQKLQLDIQKTKQDIAAGPGGGKLQFVAGTANQPAGTFNPATGQFTPIKGTDTTSPMQLAQAQSNIDQINTLITAPNTAGAVGATPHARITPFNEVTTGAKSNYIANVQQVSQQLTLDALQNAKANGATFGALSEGELGLLSQSATKLNSWAIKDKDGNVTGYNTNPATFNAELDKINRFSVLDYALKGGDPTTFPNVTEMNDGTIWYKNKDGSVTEIR